LRIAFERTGIVVNRAVELLLPEIERAALEIRLRLIRVERERVVQIRERGSELILGEIRRAASGVRRRVSGIEFDGAVLFGKRLREVAVGARLIAARDGGLPVRAWRQSGDGRRRQGGDGRRCRFRRSPPTGSQKCQQDDQRASTARNPTHMARDISLINRQRDRHKLLQVSHPVGIVSRYSSFAKNVRIITRRNFRIVLSRDLRYNGDNPQERKRK
jgi:hypothetical protein